MDRNTTADQLVELGLDLGVRGNIFEEGVLKILNDPELDNETKAKIIGYSHCNWEALVLMTGASLFRFAKFTYSFIETT